MSKFIVYNLLEMNLTPFYKLHKKYSLTLNPTDKYQFFNKVDRFRRFKSFVAEQFLAVQADYKLYIEVSEPNGFKTQGYSGPRLHLHGWIEFYKKKDLAQWLLRDSHLIYKWTSMDIDTIGDSVKWEQYCTKQKIWINRIIEPFKST